MSNNSPTATKKNTRDEAVTLRARLSREGKKVVFTSGVFDLLHPGHVDYLEKARALGDALFVAINSDDSVRQNKGPLRPICTAEARAQVIAALESVTCAFEFSEKNNQQNISLLKPDVYVKAGDYNREKLSSAPLVESYGGTVSFVPLVSGYSSSAIIESVVQKYTEGITVVPDVVTYEPRPAVFMDRDGTLNEPVPYLHEPRKLRLYSDVLPALRELSKAGFRLIVVTNQPGIGLGYFTKEDFYLVNKEFLTQVSRAGVKIDKVLFCPHSEADGCGCRKPSPVAINRVIRQMNIIREKSFMIGDLTSDIQFAKNVGVGSILVGTGEGGGDKKFSITADFDAPTFSDAVNYILARQKTKS